MAPDGPRSPVASATLAADAGFPVRMTLPVPFRLGDRVELRRAHPCGGRAWEVDRLGADIGLRCATCGHHVLLERRAVERRLVGFAVRGPDVGAR
jgi:hypothetical protein